MAVLLKTDVRFLLFEEVYSRMEDPKTRRKAFFLLEAAIQCYSKRGFDPVTLAMIAREAGVTRPLLKHYFADLDEIRELTAKYIRLLFQRFVIDEVAKESRPESMIERYIESCFKWVDQMPSHSRVWLSYLHRCSRLKPERRLNSIAAEGGRERIEAMIRLGLAGQVFRCADPAKTAKMIQTLIMGGMITYAAEEIEDNAAFIRTVRDHCFQWLGPGSGV